MRRVIFRILNFLSILMLGFSIVWCIVGMSQGAAAFHRGDETLSGFITVKGWAAAFHFETIGGLDSKERGWSMQEFRIRDLDIFDEEPDATSLKFPGFAFHYSPGFPNLPLHGAIIAIHFGLLIPLCAVLPAYWLLTRHKHARRRAKLGLCVKCGYDLRGGTSGACPECGTPVQAPDEKPNSQAG